MRTTREKFPYTGYEIPMSDADTLPMTTSTDPAANAAVSTAIVDANSGVIITLTAAGNAQTIQDPTDTTLIRQFTVINNDTSTDSIVVNGITMAAGDAQSFAWDGSAWIAIASTYATTTTDGVVELATGAEAVTGTDALRAITPSTLTSRLAAPGDIGNTTPATSVAIDNLLLDANTLSSTTGDINITPKAGEDVVIDGHWEFDGPLVTAITDNDTTITAYTGKAISIESVTFDGGVATATTVNATTFDTNVAAAAVTLSGTTLAADGTDAAINISISPKGTGEVDISKVDIDGGAIDGTTIGETTPAPGSFTTLTTSGTVTHSGLTASRVVTTNGSKQLTSSNDITSFIAAATDAAAGIVELATSTEVAAGSDAGRVVTPAGLAALHQYQAVYVPAAGMTPTTTNGAAAGTYEYATQDINMDYLAFDGATEEYAEFQFPMPENWDRGTIKAKFFWTSATGSTAGDTVEWELAGGALSDDDAIDAALGTSQVISDTLLADNGADLQVSSATPAITIGGTPVLGDLIHFKVSRNVGGTDDMAEDAWLLGVWIQYKVTNTVSAW